MRRKLYFSLFVLALILIALPGFAAKGAKRLTRVKPLRPAIA
jgi:hypothetical protein